MAILLKGINFPVGLLDIVFGGRYMYIVTFIQGKYDT